MPFIMRRRPHLAAASAAAILGALASGRGAIADPAPPFAELLVQAQGRAPRLAEAAAGVRQAQGLARQAAARPNPTASVEMENFGGNGPFRGLDQAETTFSVGQPLELGGKRGARIAAGRAGLEAARARLSQSRADYGFELAAAYGDAEAADRQVALAQEQLALANEDLRAARALVEAGKEAELRQLQAQAGVTSARAAVDAARTARTAAFARLTALAGSNVPFTSLAERLLERPAPASLGAGIDPLSVPAVLTAQAERDATAKRVRVEQTRAFPDVTVSAGVRRLSGDDTTALVAGISVPIPIFDRNRGNITAAEGELQAAEARLNAARLDAEAELRTALFEVQAAQTRVAAAQQSESTAAEAYRLTRIAYEAGKSPLVELLSARRALAEARTQTIQAQQQRLRAAAGLARLQGRMPFGVS